MPKKSVKEPRTTKRAAPKPFETEDIISAMVLPSTLASPPFADRGYLRKLGNYAVVASDVDVISLALAHHFGEDVEMLLVSPVCRNQSSNGKADNER